MPKGRLFLKNFRRALQTTHSRDSLPLGEYLTFQDVRIDQQSAIRRPGKRRVASVAGGVQSSMAFVRASTDRVRVPLAPVHTMGRVWTWRAIWSDVNDGTAHGIIGWDDLTDWPVRLESDTATGLVNAYLKDTLDAVTTLTSTTVYAAGTRISAMVIRDGVNVRLEINGLIEDSGVIGDVEMKVPTEALLLGSDLTSGGLEGSLDSVSYTSSVYKERGPGMRLVQPRAPYCYADYNLRADVDGLVIDRSRYGNHGVWSGTAPASAAPLAEIYAPVSGMFPFRNRAGERRVALISGGQFRLVRAE